MPRQCSPSLTKEQKEFIKNNYMEYNNKQLAIMFGVQENYIGTFLNSIGIYRNTTIKNTKKVVKFQKEEGEKFKNIKDFPDYQVSNHGRVINIRSGKLLKPFRDYKVERGECLFVLKVELINGNIKKDFYLNRLVKETFEPIPNSESYYIVHIDNDNTNLRLDNLKYKRKEKLDKPNSYKYSDKTIRIICAMLEDNRTYKEIRRITNINFTNIYLDNIKYRKIRKDISKDYNF